MVALSGWLAFNLIFRKPATQVVYRQNTPMDEVKIDAEKIAESVDKKGFGKTVLERKNKALQNADLSKLPVSQATYDSLRLDNIDKSAKLQQASAIIAKAEAKNLQAKRVIDSLTGREQFLYTDDFVRAMFTPDSTGGQFNVAWDVKLIRHDYKKRSWLLAPYRYYTDILSPDPRIKIGGLQNLTIESHRPTRWGLGLQAGYHYNPATKQFTPSVGVGLSYNLIRF